MLVHVPPPLSFLSPSPSPALSSSSSLSLRLSRLDHRPSWDLSLSRLSVPNRDVALDHRPPGASASPPLSNLACMFVWPAVFQVSMVEGRWRGAGPTYLDNPWSCSMSSRIHPLQWCYNPSHLHEIKPCFWHHLMYLDSGVISLYSCFHC